MRRFSSIIDKEIIISRVGTRIIAPCILTDNGYYWPIIEYFQSISGRSYQTLRNIACGVADLMDFVILHKNYHNKPEVLFSSWANAYLNGTFNKGLDPSLLCWHPKTPEYAANIIRGVLKFFDFLSRVYGTTHPNPLRKATTFEKKVLAVANYHKRHMSLMSHINDTPITETRDNPAKSCKKSTSRSHETTYWTKSDIFKQLFEDGVTNTKYRGKRDVRLILRDQLILMLMRFGGLRLSEALTLWIFEDDVCIDRNPESVHYGCAKVRIYMEDIGRAPEGWKNPTGGKDIRQEYLDQKFGLIPRCRLPGNKRVGFKGNPDICKNKDRYLEVDWIYPEIAKKFANLWDKYIAYRWQLQKVCNHPFAFIVFEKEHLGNSLIPASFRKQQAQAYKRIGKEASKEKGTTPHGNRHFFGREAVRMEHEPRDIQQMMHHASLESQERYTRLSVEERNKIYQQAYDQIDGKIPIEHKYEPLDYLEEYSKYQPRKKGYKRGKK